MARRKKQQQEYKPAVYHYNSVIEFAEYCMAENIDTENTGSRRPKSKGFNDGTWEEATERVMHGDSARVQGVVKAAAEVKREIEEIQYHKKHDVAGSYLDIGRYLDGEPECFVRRMRSKQERKVATIGINTVASCGVSDKELFNRGGAIIALIDNLLDAGVIVNVVVDMQIFNKEKGFAETHLIHLDANNLDVDALAYAVTSADFLRRFGFAAIERMLKKNGSTDPVNDAHNDGYGKVNEDAPDGQGYDIYCKGLLWSSYGNDFKSPEKAAVWVNNIIDRYNAGTEQMIVA